MNRANAHRLTDQSDALIEAPTLIVMGTEDRSYASSFDLQKAIPGSEHKSGARERR